VPEEFDFAAALDGAALFHISGITAALGPGGVELARAGIKAARAAGVPVSFDCNFREKLWGAWDSNPREILLELLAEATIMFGNHRDMTLLLQKPFSGDGAERRREAVEAAFATFPGLQVMASTARHPITQTHHRLSARVDLREDRHQTPEIEITDIVDRVGSGDAFAAGVLTGWLEVETPKDGAAWPCHERAQTFAAWRLAAAAARGNRRVYRQFRRCSSINLRKRQYAGREGLRRLRIFRSNPAPDIGRSCPARRPPALTAKSGARNSAALRIEQFEAAVHARLIAQF
jgi:sugar/nucleoside kinase (ribokinase family)